MKFLIVSLALVAAAAADVSHLGEAAAAIIRSESDVHPEGFSSVYETSNGISAQSQGVLKTIGQDVVIEITGSYQYTAPDGTPIQVTYRADENGFQPQGAHLPTPPPAPEHVLRTLQLAANPANVVAQRFEPRPQAFGRF